MSDTFNPTEYYGEAIAPNVWRREVAHGTVQTQTRTVYELEIDGDVIEASAVQEQHYDGMWLTEWRADLRVRGDTLTAEEIDEYLPPKIEETSDEL